MSDGALAASTNEAVDLGRRRSFDTILYRGFVVGLPTALLARRSAKAARRDH
ncbi:MAG TPA: hypothetical protein VGJ66_02930 [Pyrinomonadaceae bacterium]|jgi:hypothetical protein